MKEAIKHNAHLLFAVRTGSKPIFKVQFLNPYGMSLKLIFHAISRFSLPNHSQDASFIQKGSILCSASTVMSVVGTTVSVPK